MLNSQLFPQAQFLNQGAVLVNVFFRIVAQQTLALADHVQQRAAARVVFLLPTKVVGEAFDAVGQQGDLNFYVARVLCVFAVLRNDFGDFGLVVIDCHFLKII